MKLIALEIQNFKGISQSVTVLIDQIVLLIGPNNCSKSTVLDAYEAYYSMGSALSIEFFNSKDATKKIEIVGVFSELSQEDIDNIGSEWLLEKDSKYGRCAKFKVQWNKPDEDGEKYSFSSKINDWKKGGAGGWNSILKSRIPTPLRINPNDGYDEYEKIIKDLIAKSTIAKIKSDKSRLGSIIGEIERLAKEIESEISAEVNTINDQIKSQLEKIFSGTNVGFETGVGKFKVEDAIKDGSRFVVSSNGSTSGLEHQGSGMRRAFLWSAIHALCQGGRLKRGTTIITTEEPKILLLDEPEINLHPAVIRLAREAIYSLANVAGWQVMCTTHSPVFIDLTYDHTTIIRMARTGNDVLYFQTDIARFSGDEKEELKMLNICCPTMNEFFFYDRSILVEGDSEFIAFNYLIKSADLSNTHCVINCRGKANIPTFIKIFNQFHASAYALHDADTRLNGDGSKNAMWSINHKIRDGADVASGRVITVMHVPDFEGYYFSEKPKKDKPYNTFRHFQAKDFMTNPLYDKIRSALTDIISGRHPGIYANKATIDALP